MTFIPFSGAQIYSTDNLNISQRADMYTVTIRTANITELFRIIDSCKSPIFYTYNNESADLRGNTFIQNHIIEKNKIKTISATPMPKHRNTKNHARALP